ncbi:MAG: DUF3048 domain-containing protein [Blastochloris sp.]|nr:DUF3048 domain-containing protein [Blastochloris sp.]
MRRAIPLFVLFLILSAFLSASAQQTTSSIQGPERYDQGINPLTGLPVADPALLNRRPIIVKIDNYPPEIRPQTGVSRAEIVWEHLLSGGVTRLSAVFLADDLEMVGPVRSSRLIDFELVRIYRALFAYSGMAQGTLDRLRADPVANSRAVGGSGPCPPYCRYPREGVALEHTLFASLPGVRALAVERNRDITPEPITGMAFDADVPASGTSVRGVRVAYRQTEIEWQYEPTVNRWLRFQDGEPHLDATDNTQLSAANLAIIEANHIEQPVVSDGYWGPPNYAFTVELVGSGRLFLLRDGQFWEGEWRREDSTAPLMYYDLVGNTLPFTPGNTFVNLVPRWTNGYNLGFLLNEPLQATVGSTGANLRRGPGENAGVIGAAPQAQR